MERDDTLTEAGCKEYAEVYRMASPGFRCRLLLRDLELADVPGFTLRFRLDLTPLIDQNRRRSRATLADFVIEEAAKTA